MENAFEHLTADDRALMVEKGDTKEYQKGDVILEEGDRRRILYIIIEGSCRVEQSHLGKGIAVANLGPDEFFGDMSFLEGIGASASVVADEPVKVLSITPDSVSTLLQSVPGLATRFYQSLSVNLSRRLRETTAMFPKLLVEEVAEVQLFHPEHTGLAGEAQIPPSLMEDVGDFKTAMLGIEQEIIAGKTPEDKIQEKVSGACQAMKDSLNKHIENETLLDRAVGGYVLRETFPYFMSGRLTDRAYTKPRGYSGDFGTIEILYENVEKGDGRLGPFIDRWAMDLK
ncbi:MAG: cyclic nucleotide-binding domain-containing protein, partial [Candidatus Binatia bacterium]|nr:cyclic nucleotide-binding domain-containing protein [Candidatus Binatia bacterium]